MSRILLAAIFLGLMPMPVEASCWLGLFGCPHHHHRLKIHHHYLRHRTVIIHKDVTVINKTVEPKKVPSPAIPPIEPFK